MNRRDEFLKSQKVLRLATSGKNKTLHIAPVWYRYSRKRIYIGTNTKTQKAKNIKKNKQVAFCVDVGINASDIYGVMAQGNANLILEHKITNENKIAIIDFLLRYKNEKLKITDKVKQKSVPHKTEIKQNMLFSEKERLSRIKKSELLRLKKWVK